MSDSYEFATHRPVIQTMLGSSSDEVAEAVSRQVCVLALEIDAEEAPLEPSRDGIAGMARDPGGRRHAHTLDLDARCFRHQLLLPRPYLILTKPLRLDIQCQRAASVKIGWKYLDD